MGAELQSAYGDPCGGLCFMMVVFLAIYCIICIIAGPEKKK